MIGLASNDRECQFVGFLVLDCDPLIRRLDSLRESQSVGIKETNWQAGRQADRQREWIEFQSSLIVGSVWPSSTPGRRVMEASHRTQCSDLLCNRLYWTPKGRDQEQTEKKKKKKKQKI